MTFQSWERLPNVYQIEDSMGVCMTLLVGETRALLIDTGYGLEDVNAFVRTITDLPISVLLTHGHHDHALGARWFDEVCLLAQDQSVYETYTGEPWRRSVISQAKRKGLAPDEAAMLAARYPAPTLIGERTLDLGGLTAQILLCPGHTPGSAVVYVRERSLLLTGDDWNPTTWLFFPEALGVREYRENLRGLLRLRFDNVLCSHSRELHQQLELEAFAKGLDDASLAKAMPTPIGGRVGADAREMHPVNGQTLVFDATKAALG